MNKNQRDSIKQYNQLAKNYDDSFDGRFTARFKNKMLEYCDVLDCDKALDVGCGNGTLINAISKKADIQAYGVDISQNMIEECRNRYSNIKFEVSTAENLNFENDSLDLVMMCCVLHHLNDASVFFKEAHRVLKPNGVLVIGEPWFPFGIRHFVNWIISPLLRAGDNKIFTHKKLRRLFMDNSFEILQIYKKGTMQIIKARK